MSTHSLRGVREGTRFRLLGPVEVQTDDGLIPVGHARQRAVLAVLLLNVGQVVPIERLVDLVWGDQPPPTARGTLYGYVYGLRRALITGGVNAEVVRRSGGYLIDTEPERVDLHRFRRLVADAGDAEGQQQVRLLDTALRLWRGTALGGVDSDWLSRVRQALDGERIAALLARNEIELELGRHAELVGALHEATAARPYDERLAGQLMLALYRCGKPAEALSAFQRVRRLLKDDLGTDPSGELCHQYQRIMCADPDLATPRPSTPQPTSLQQQAGRPPTDRRAELARLCGTTGPAHADTSLVASPSSWRLLGENMRATRDGAGVSLTSAASLLDYGKSHLHMIEQGREHPNEHLVHEYDERFGGNGLLWSIYLIARAPELAGTSTGDVEIPETQVTTAHDQSVFIADVTLPDGSVVHTGDRLTKIWRIRNAGSVPWTGRRAVRIGPRQGTMVIGSPTEIPLPEVAPGNEVDIRVNIRAPVLPGTTFALWKMADSHGKLSFPTLEHGIYVLLNVISPNRNSQR